MKVEELKKNSRGVTLIILVITVILVMILAGVTMNFVIDDKVIDETKGLTNKMEEQSEEHQSLSNMVRNLYEK